MIEAAKSFGRGECSFFDQAEYDAFAERYGTMENLRTFGSLPPVELK